MTSAGEEARAGAGRRGAAALGLACLVAQAGCTGAAPNGSVNSAVSAAGAVASNLRAAAQATRAPSPAPTPGGPSGDLLVPVAGVRPEDLQDTYTQSRAEGRTHDAIDIPAAAGAPVLAAADGPVVKLFNSERGGITLYQLGTDGRTVYYYAHLQRYADGLAEGHFARRGETIAYVGDTGNAGAGNYHLHFSVSTVADPKRWWSGTNVNPYPLLTGKQ